MEDQVRNHVFQVLTSLGTGTAFYVADFDLFVTNFHVIAGHREVALKGLGHTRDLARVVLVNPDADLAFLRCDRESPGGAGIQLIEGARAKRGQRIHIHGYPLGLSYTVTDGVVSAEDQPLDGRHYLQTDAAINPGNSGGPMVDDADHLLGVTTLKVNDAENVGLGIHAADLIAELQDYSADDEMYHVRCNSCRSLIVEESLFCAFCGGGLPSAAFDLAEPTAFVRFVEAALAGSDMDPVLARGGEGLWEFHRGSALVRIFVHDQSFLIAHSPISQIPQRDLGPLLEFLASAPVRPYTLGIGGNQIHVSYRVHISDLFSELGSQISEELGHLAIKADELDDLLKERFGCEMSVEARQEMPAS